MAEPENEDALLRSVALQNARAILLARQRAEEELLRTKQALSDSEERLRAIFDYAAVGITVVALDGHFLDTNRKFTAILGYTGFELQKLTVADITHPDDMASTTASMLRLVDGAVPDFSLEKRYRRKDGSTVWCLTTVTLIRSSSGQALQFIGVIEDITPRKKVEAALREETRMLELLNESGKVLASQLDLKAVVQVVTDAATQVSGAKFGALFYNTADDKDDSLLLHTLSGAAPESFEHFGQPRATALFGPTFAGEPVIRCDDVLTDPRYGQWGPHYGMPKGHLPVRSYLAVSVRSRSGDVIGGLFFGHPEPKVFTERSARLVSGIAAQAGIAIDNARLFEAAKKSADERTVLLESERAARSVAERTSELKDEFLATLSHELRTPLNAIVGWSQVLRRAPRGDVDFLKGLDTIERNARIQTQLIEDLLDMSRIASGKLRMDVQSLHPASFIEEAVETVRPAADAKGIRLEKVLDPAAGPIAGDPSRLQQVIWNLLSNAIKFTPRHGKVQVLLERVNSHVEISVADTGVGIKPEFIEHLFERFRQGDSTTTRKFGGLGLGLSIVKSLVELHGGTVNVRSAGEDHGTTVTVHLPVTVVHRPAAPEERAHPRTPGPGPTEFVATELTGVKVLVVDDQIDARGLTKRVLEDCGAQVVMAGGAREAIDLIESVKPDVLISDIGMPDIDGFELLRLVRALGAERGGKVPAIALTAFARSDDRTRTLRAGFLVHLSKPVEPTELVATVASVAGRLRLDHE